MTSIHANAKLNEIQHYSPFMLSGIADCGTPDSWDSQGSGLLIEVRDATVKLIQESEPDADRETLIDCFNACQEGAPSIFTHNRWQEFVDLSAYSEEPDSGEWPADLTEMAGEALNQIIDRLGYALIEEWLEAREQEDDA